MQVTKSKCGLEFKAEDSLSAHRIPQKPPSHSVTTVHSICYNILAK